ncbi:hypothetical protein [Limnoraphis robusta]|uniref:Uncharacterized protein n=1 Tax=Limnoraphis robusta CS-951 TaxID=1637645 RepID=A0A0F5YB56_9CYAN|nr:hypothetical protein [Limnoraphis robusta]KKD35465.1 hypothetical protein WN50_25190 [Limnoraphis robusta CS-951]
MKAAVNVQTAESMADWNIVTTQWEEAINLLKIVPKLSENYSVAQSKITEYQRNLDYAKNKVALLDPLNQAMNKAQSAANLTQTAKSYDQWNQVYSGWKDAISLLENLPESHQKSDFAQQKITEYQSNLDYAKQQMTRTDPFVSGTNKAEEAVLLQPNAVLEADWNEVANCWQKAITLLKTVSQTHPQYQTASQKITEYQQNLSYAQKQANLMRQATVAVMQNSLPVSSPQSPPSSPTQQSVKPQVSNSAQQPTNNPQPSNPPTSPQPQPVSGSATDFMNAYLNDIVNKGSYGYGYWCKSSEILSSRLFSPRNFQVLDVNEYDNGNSASATVRIDSSNKGGMPITQNWRFYLDKETDPSAVEGLPGGWCIALMFDS